MAMNLQAKVQEYFNRQIADFLTGERCCLQFCESLRPTDNEQLADFASTYNLRTTRFVNKGMDVLKIHKSQCIHFAETPFKFGLRDFSQKELYLFHLSSDLMNNSGIRLQMSPDFIANEKPKANTVQFCSGRFTQTMVRKSNIFDCIMKMRRKSCLAPFQNALIHCINRSRVMVINGERAQDKSVMIPLYILENCQKLQKPCKIIVIEKEPLIAICNAERLADIIDEKVGDTISYQVPLQSRIAANSNVIYTSAFYFLRYLVGRSHCDSFRHITHMVINDIQDRNAYIDLLISELSMAMQLNTNLHTVLLAKSQSNSEFLDYFGMGEEFFLCLSPSYKDNQMIHQNPIDVYYIEDIYQINTKMKPLVDSTLAYKALTPPNGAEIDSNSFHMDGCLDVYHQYGNEKAFSNVLYMIKGEYVSVNYKHSINGSSAAIIAAKLGQARHLRILLDMNADPYLMDNCNMNAYSYAMEKCNKELNDILNLYCGDVYLTQDCVPTIIDYNLIVNLINNLLTSSDWIRGHIIVIMPSYRHASRLFYYLLRHQFIGNLPASFGVRLLFDTIDKESLKELARPNKSCPMVILATEFAESAIFLSNITYVIDTMRIERLVYNPKTLCSERTVQWISKERAENRSKIAGLGMICNEVKSTCFRIVPKSIFKGLPVKTEAELKTMPLDQICLMAKLISPFCMAGETLQKCLDAPPFIHVHQAVGLLSKLEVLDEMEDVTWLGCRIIDLNLPCMLAKLLIMGTTLQCFDPILTMVCIQTVGDPLELPIDVESNLEPFIINMRQKIKEKRYILSEGKDSDHLMLLRLYEEWQNEKDQQLDTQQLTLVDEHHFVLNRLFERVSEKRLHLVASMRACQLIHNHGIFSMTTINSRSNSWPIIKGALVAGLYPNISYIDTVAGRLKSSKTRELMLSPASSLRTLNLINIKLLAKSHHSQWIIFGSESNSVTCNSIDYCTLVLPITIAIFGGPSKLHPNNISNQVPNISNYFIDDFLWLQACDINAQLVFKTRQYFYHIYQTYLQNCTSLEKWRNVCHANFFDMLDRVLRQEEMTHGFNDPINVGVRPKAKLNKPYIQFNEFLVFDHLPTRNNLNGIHPTTQSNNPSKPIEGDCFGNVKADDDNKSLTRSSSDEKKLCLIQSNHNLHVHNEISSSASSLSVSIDSKFQVIQSNASYKCLSKHYFVAHMPDNEYITRHVVKETLECLLRSEGLEDNQMVYVFLYTLSPDHFHSVLLARCDRSDFDLYECFHNKVPLSELIDVCLHNYIFMPSFSKMYCGYLDDRVGAIILELFAYRNNWLHSYSLRN